MFRRLSAASALVLATLTLAPSARAQGFFGFFETSPREVVNRLEDDGYTPRLPMIRRGEVYIVDARAASGRSVRLVVDARDGHVIQRYVAAPSVRDDDYYERRAPRRFADDNPDDAPVAPRHRVDPPRNAQTAWGDPLPVPPRDDIDEGPRVRPDAPAEKAKPHAAHKHHDAVAKDTPDADTTMGAVSPKPTVTKPTPEASPAPRLATARPDVTPKPSPEAVPVKPASPKPDVAARPSPEATQAKVEPKPVEPKPVEPKPAAPKPEVAAKPLPTPTTTSAVARTEAKPTPAKPLPEPVQASAEVKPAAPAPKPEAPHKKINDLPVGTLD